MPQYALPSYNSHWSLLHRLFPILPLFDSLTHGSLLNSFWPFQLSYCSKICYWYGHGRCEIICCRVAPRYFSSMNPCGLCYSWGEINFDSDLILMILSRLISSYPTTFASPASSLTPLRSRVPLSSSQYWTCPAISCFWPFWLTSLATYFCWILTPSDQYDFSCDPSTSRNCPPTPSASFSWVSPSPSCRVGNPIRLKAQRPLVSGPLLS